MSRSDFRERYSLKEIENYVIEFIKKPTEEAKITKEFKVALQFPDHLLNDSIDVCSALTDAFEDKNEEVGSKTVVFFVLGDTSYGECCVDEVNSEHYTADLILHFGRTCFSTPNRVPSVFVLDKAPIAEDSDARSIQCINISEKMSKIDNMMFTNTLFLADSCYQYCVHEIASICENANYSVIPTSLNVIPDLSYQHKCNDHLSQDKILGRCIYSNSGILSLDLYNNIVFLSKGNIEENATFKTLLINYCHSHKIYSLNLSSSVSEIIETDFKHSKFLMQRYNLMEQAKEAKIIGIIMGTLSVSSTKETLPGDLSSNKLTSSISILKDAICKANKKYYEILIGKLNEPKIQNFTCIDMYVVVACRENSIYYSQQFGKPIITPYELLVALGSGLEWESKIITDFESCVKAYFNAPQEDKEIDEYEEMERQEQHQIMIKEYGELANVFEQTTIERFKEMTFKGLEINEDSTPASLEDGKFGIASSYKLVSE